MAPALPPSSIAIFFFPARRLISQLFFFSSRRRHTMWTGDWSSDVCSSDLREFQGQFRLDAVSGVAGVRIVHAAAANVRIFIFDFDAAGAGEIPAGSFVAVVDAAADFSGVGEHTRILHHRHRRGWIVSGCWIGFVRSGKREGGCLDPGATLAAGEGFAVVPGSSADYALRDATGGLSV